MFDYTFKETVVVEKKSLYKANCLKFANIIIWKKQERDLNVFLIHYGAFLGKNELEFLLDLGGIIPLLHVPATTTTTTAATKRDCPPKKSCDWKVFLL